MRQNMVKIHAVAATLALLIITTFFISTLVSELFGDKQQIVTVKTYIFYAIWLLIPLMATTGIIGNKLAPNAKSGVIGKKKKRMPFIALNGIFILIPSAIYLRSLAIVNIFDTTFYLVQALELTAGLINITLMSLNLNDGLKLRKAKQKT